VAEYRRQPTPVDDARRLRERVASGELEQEHASVILDDALERAAEREAAVHPGVAQGAVDVLAGVETLDPSITTYLDLKAGVSHSGSL
jgi:hypothetical protein